MPCNGIYQTNYIVLNVRASGTTKILAERLAAGAKQCLLQIWSPATNIYESMVSDHFWGDLDFGDLYAVLSRLLLLTCLDIHKCNRHQIFLHQCCDSSYEIGNKLT